MIVQSKSGMPMRNHSVDGYDYQQVTDSPKESPVPPRKPIRLNSEPSGNYDNRYRSHSTPTPPKPNRRRSSLRLSNSGMAKNCLQENVESNNDQIIETNNTIMLPPQGPVDRSPRLSVAEQDLDNDGNDSYGEEYDSSTVCLIKISMLYIIFSLLALVRLSYDKQYG